MDLSIEPPCQHVTWKVQDFLQLPSEVGYSLDSPKIRFADDSYCLRLYPKGDRSRNIVVVDIILVRLTSTIPEKDVSFKLGFRGKAPEVEFDKYWRTLTNRICIRRSFLRECRNLLVPNGILTVVCSMHLGEQSNAESAQSEEAESSSAAEEHELLPGQSVFLSSLWRPFRMELSVESPCQTVTWKVRDFFQLPSEIGYCLESPEFRFAGDKFCLRLYPNGDRNGDKTKIHLQLVRRTSTFSERTILYKLGSREYTQSKLFDCDIYSLPRALNDEFVTLLHSRSSLVAERYMDDTDGNLTVLCFLSLGTSNAEEKQEGLPNVAKLQSDYRRLLQKGAESDACLVVSGKEFKVHRVVLRARSTVFDAMFGHEMAEKKSGRVPIDDLDPENFGEFLEYLYAGGVGAGFSDKNVFGLYTAADKYDVPTLKSECVVHILRTLSVDSFCDVMTLALRHNEEELLQRAIQFFKQNMQRIIVTAKWTQFVIDNGTSANELFIKALVPRRQ